MVCLTTAAQLFTVASLINSEVHLEVQVALLASCVDLVSQRDRYQK